MCVCRLRGAIIIGRLPVCLNMHLWLLEKITYMIEQRVGSRLHKPLKHCEVQICKIQSHVYILYSLPSLSTIQSDECEQTKLV